eukprot:g43887.t1
MQLAAVTSSCRIEILYPKSRAWFVSSNLSLPSEPDQTEGPRQSSVLGMQQLMRCAAWSGRAGHHRPLLRVGAMHGPAQSLVLLPRPRAHNGGADHLWRRAGLDGPPLLALLRAGSVACDLSHLHGVRTAANGARKQASHCSRQRAAAWDHTDGAAATAAAAAAARHESTARDMSTHPPRSPPPHAALAAPAGNMPTASGLTLWMSHLPCLLSADLASLPSHSALLVPLLTYGTPVAAQLLFLSSLLTMKQFARAKSTLGVSPLPYAMMVPNGVLWMCYGALAHDMAIFLPYVSSLLLGAYYLRTFQRYMGPEERLLPHVVVAAGLSGWCLAATALLQPAHALHVLGLTGCAVTVGMFGAPLTVIRTVLRTKNAEALPLGWTLATLLNCSCWVGYGALVIGDPYIWGPSTLGVASGLVQLALIVRFGRGPAPRARQQHLSQQ